VKIVSFKNRSSQHTVDNCEKSDFGRKSSQTSVDNSENCDLWGKPGQKTHLSQLFAVR